MTNPYRGSSQRTFQYAARRLLEKEYGFINSRRVMGMLAADMEKLADEFRPQAACVPPGWLVFTATKATGRKAFPGKSAGDYPLVTLAWPVLLTEDIIAEAQITTGSKGRQQRKALLKKRLQRIIEHGLHQPDGPIVLTCTDLGLMLGRTHGQISNLLGELRRETGQALPTKGYFFDQGVRPSAIRLKLLASTNKGWMKLILPVSPITPNPALAAICAIMNGLSCCCGMLFLLNGLANYQAFSQPSLMLMSNWSSNISPTYCLLQSSAPVGP